MRVFAGPVVLLGLLCAMSSPARAGTVRVYRGLTVAPNRLKLAGDRGYSGNQSDGGRWWVARDRSVSLEKYAVAARQFTTLLELDVPRGRIHYPAEALQPWTRDVPEAPPVGYLLRRELRSMEPYLRRIGLVWNPLGAWERQRVRWFDLKDARRRGLFRQDANYERIFSSRRTAAAR